MEDVITLTRRGRRLRLAAATSALLGLLYGTVWGSDDHFPFGPMVQYAFAADPNGTVPDLYIEADTTAGTRVKVTLSPQGVGIVRAEIEEQLDDIKRDPSKLQAVADAHARLHPDQPRYTHLYLRIRHTHLRDGVATHDTIEDVTEWAVR